MENNVSEYIERKKKSKRRKKIVLFTAFFLLLLVLFLAKAPIFNVRKVEYSNNKIIKSEELYKLYEPLGVNIFFIDNKVVEENLKKNPYIDSVKIIKKMPNKLTIQIKEKAVTYCVEDGKQKYILSNDLSVLESRADVKDLNLTLLINPKPDVLKIGKTVYSDSRRIEIGKKLASLIERNQSKITFDKFDMGDPNKLIIYHGDVKIFLGSDDELENKLNKGINILQDDVVNIKKGTIDVSFKGSPVIKREN